MKSKIKIAAFFSGCRIRRWLDSQRLAIVRRFNYRETLGSSG
nr:MAG TPA: hypothetical protein [Caudoviricetes sp.]